MYIRTQHKILARLRELRFSFADHVKEPLESFITSDPVLKSKVRVIRLPQRGGLIIARQTGARAAEGQVLIFLDSHTEANYNWLPPLLGKRKMTLFFFYYLHKQLC